MFSHYCHSTSLYGSSYVVVTIKRLTPERDKHIIPAHFAAIDRDVTGLQIRKFRTVW
jgi:hypothetical protein